MLFPQGLWEGEGVAVHVSWLEEGQAHRIHASPLIWHIMV